MKKNLVLIILTCLLISLQSCESKKEKEEKEEKELAQEPVIENTPTLTKEEKRVAKEQRRLATIEKRNAALVERLKKGIYFTGADGKLIYLKAETEPSFPGGDEAMREYLKKTIEYPTEASENGDEGTVFVDFIVSESGEVREVTVNDESSERGDTYLRDEAIRVVKSMPLWNPGKQQGKAVEVAFNLPITFRLD
jgi:TonB family protein